MRGPLGRRPVVEACRHGAPGEVLDGEDEHDRCYSPVGAALASSMLRRTSSTSFGAGSSTTGDVDHGSPASRATLTAPSKIVRASGNVTVIDFGVAPSPGSNSRIGAPLGTV